MRPTYIFHAFSIFLLFAFMGCETASESDQETPKDNQQASDQCADSRGYFLSAVAFAGYRDSLTQKITEEIQNSEMQPATLGEPITYPDFETWQKGIFPQGDLSPTDSLSFLCEAVFETLPYGWMHTEQPEFYAADLPTQYQIISNGYSGNCFHFSLFSTQLLARYNIPSLVLTISLSDEDRELVRHVLPVAKLKVAGATRWVPFDPTMGIVWIDENQEGIDLKTMRASLNADNSPAVTTRKTENGKGRFATPGTCLAPEIAWPYSAETATVHHLMTDAGALTLVQGPRDQKDWESQKAIQDTYLRLIENKGFPPHWEFLLLAGDSFDVQGEETLVSEFTEMLKSNKVPTGIF